MSVKLKAYYEEQQELFLNQCIECGKCVTNCALGDEFENPKNIIQHMKAFLNDENCDMELVKKRATLCLECFKCAKNTCQKGINPMIICEILNGKLAEKGLLNFDFDIPGHISDTQKEGLLRKLNSQDELDYITEESIKKNSKYLFFPGCNVYNQPDKVVKSRKVIDYILGAEYSFIPGQTYCCSGNCAYYGDIDNAHLAVNTLYDKIKAINPEYVILWCPTCLCRFETTIDELSDYNVKFISLSDFLLNHLDKLHFKTKLHKRATLHEPCKSAYNNTSNHSLRKVLRAIPEIELIEMEKHGEHTMCCGLGIMEYSPEMAEAYKHKRLNMARDENVDMLIDVCHACHAFFLQSKDAFDYDIVNYMDLIYDSLGLE